MPPLCVTRRNDTLFNGRRNLLGLPFVSLERIGPAVGTALPSGEVGGFGGEIESRAPALRRSATTEKMAALENLTDYDTVTKCHLERLASLLPVGAFYAAREEVARCHPSSEARYAVAVLNRWHREGRYA